MSPRKPALVRQSAIIAAAAKDPRLKKRTLTNLYNERPKWLKLAHEQLDRAVLAAYAATDPQGGWSEDWAAVWTDTGAGQPLSVDHPLFVERQKVDQLVLANLLRSRKWTGFVFPGVVRWSTREGCHKRRTGCEARGPAGQLVCSGATAGAPP
jgi:hypothetical protein